MRSSLGAAEPALFGGGVFISFRAFARLFCRTFERGLQIVEKLIRHFLSEAIDDPAAKLPPLPSPVIVSASFGTRSESFTCPLKVAFTGPTFCTTVAS